MTKMVRKRTILDLACDCPFTISASVAPYKLATSLCVDTERGDVYREKMCYISGQATAGRTPGLSLWFRPVLNIGKNGYHQKGHLKSSIMTTFQLCTIFTVGMYSTYTCSTQKRTVSAFSHAPNMLEYFVVEDQQQDEHDQVVRGHCHRVRQTYLADSLPICLEKFRIGVSKKHC